MARDQKRASSDVAERRFHSVAHAARACPVCKRTARDPAAVRDHWAVCGVLRRDGGNDPKLLMGCTVRLIDCGQRKGAADADAGVVWPVRPSSSTTTVTEPAASRVTRSRVAPLAEPLHFVDMSDVRRTAARPIAFVTATARRAHNSRRRTRPQVLRKQRRLDVRIFVVPVSTKRMHTSVSLSSCFGA